MTATHDFPVHWENPEDARLFWIRETVHEPRPSVPLRRTYSSNVIGAGIERVNRLFNFPGTSRSIVVNGYTFSTEIPDPPEVAAQKMQRLKDIMPPCIAELPRRWREEFEPELERDLNAWRAFDLQHASFEALVQHLERAVEVAKRHWEIHFLVVFPVFEATKPWSEMYARLTGDKDEQAPYRLLAGFETKTTERDLALWDLSELARQSPALLTVFMNYPPTQVLHALRELPDGEAQAFLDAFDRYLAQYGDRSEGLFEQSTWREAPTFVVTVLKAYLLGARRNPHDELRAVAEERERLVAETLAKIPEAERAAFESVLRAAQAVYPLRETHAFYIDQASVSQFRYIILEIAKRLTETGVLKQPDDIFYLELQELLDVVHHPERAEPVLSGAEGIRGLIAERRANDARWLQLIPPASIGTPPRTEPPSDPEVAKFFRPIDTTVPAEPIKQLKGAAGSRGIARGPARVVLHTNDFVRVQPGDILISPTTWPTWTPLFHIIAGLVTDSGGVLSHGAIVAREYKLPAVVGTGYATRAIQDGQLLEVNGTQGVVTIL